MLLMINAHIVAIIVKVCHITADLIVLLVTWQKTYMQYKEQRGLLRGPSLVYVMLSNGMYISQYQGTSFCSQLSKHQGAFILCMFFSIVHTPTGVLIAASSVITGINILNLILYLVYSSRSIL